MAEIPKEVMEVAIGHTLQPGTMTDEDNPENHQHIVVLDVVTVHDETFTALDDDELKALYDREINGGLDDPRVMRRRIVFPAEIGGMLAGGFAEASIASLLTCGEDGDVDG